jgi:electron transport complex protein RnfD
MAQKFEQTLTATLPLLLGQVSGSIGETSALLILLCGAYLIARNFMDWRIPAAMLGAAAVLGGVFHLLDPSRYPSPQFLLLSGGLMLGAMFMATDMVASPVTPLGVWIYGAVMGVITIVIRLKGGLPEGVMYAILLGNALSPVIDKFTQPRVYGTAKKGART